MKSLKFILAAVVFSLSFVSCEVRTYPAGRSYNSKPMPPGQVKKVYGTKSAKPFAPGQRKRIRKMLEFLKFRHFFYFQC